MAELKLTSQHSGSLQPLIEGAISLMVFGEQAEWGAIAKCAASPAKSKCAKTRNQFMKTIEEILQVLAQQKPSLLETYQIARLGIFGSYVRGQQTETSDLDILVDYVQPPTLWKLVELKDYLSQLVALKVDLVTINGLKPRLRDRVLSEVIYL
jgi:uncharacterized protein